VMGAGDAGSGVGVVVGGGGGGGDGVGLLVATTVSTGLWWWGMPQVEAPASAIELKSPRSTLNTRIRRERFTPTLRLRSDGLLLSRS
jgi:hypothetical protein